MKQIETVLGPIREDQLGMTLMHEHCVPGVASPDGPYSKVEGNDPAYQEFLRSPITMENRAKVFFHMHKHLGYDAVEDPDLGIKEISYFKEAGGSTIVDVSTVGIGRNIPELQRYSRATGLNIVTCTGLYVGETHPEEFRSMSEQDLVDFFMKEINEGIDDTGVKPGYLKSGLSDDWTDREVECLHAVGTACAKSGLAMTIHPPIFKTWGDRILDVLEDAGVEMDQIVLSHCDPTLPNPDYHLSLLERGCRVQFDQFGLEFQCTYGPYVKRWLPRDIERIRHIKMLCDQGWEDKITVSMDMGGFKRVYRTYGGPGYAYIPELLYEYFLFEGVSEEQMHKILYTNPRDILVHGAKDAK